MCGLVAVLTLRGSALPAEQLARMTDIMTHRGPDDRGLLLEPPIAIGFRRLSIVDLSEAGHQPMESADRRYVIAFNGEIFNYLELRRELAGHGHQFRSQSDTEVLLAAYMQWGLDCLPRLNGMWAFVIWDRHARRLIVSRDRFGVKPLFMRRHNDSIAFASEIKVLRDSQFCELRMDQRSVADFWFNGTLDAGPETFYENVTRVSPGVALVVTADGAVQQHRYWSLQEAAAKLPLPTDPAACFAELFADSIRLRLRSDVTVGVLLSGGLDSSSIICEVARLRMTTSAPTGLRALSFSSSEYDESPYIDATIKQSGAALSSIDFDPLCAWNDLQRHLWHNDEPVYSLTSLVAEALYRDARQQGIKVLLNGQGADESLAGYANYFADYWSELLRAGRFTAAREQIAGYARTHALSVRPLLQKMYRDLIMRGPRMLPGYGRLADYAAHRRVQRDQWVTAELKSAFHKRVIPVTASLNDALQRSIEVQNLPIYLRQEDRNSMAHGVEARVPFLDYRLVTLAFRLGAEWKLRGGLGKVILREAMRDKIPEVVRNRADKFGFPVPADRWFREVLAAPMRDLLASQAVRECGLWNVAGIERDLERHCRGEINIAARLFDFAQLATWMSLSSARHRHTGAA